jgi:hypothetical protein
MENITVTSVMPESVSVALINLIDARGSLVKTGAKISTVQKAYAKALEATFGAHWYELPKGDPAKAGVKSERGMFKAAMIEAGQDSNVDVYWQRVKEFSGYVTAGNKVTGSLTTDDKTMLELKTILNRIFKSEENGEMIKSSDHKAALLDIYVDLGGDEMKLG